MPKSPVFKSSLEKQHVDVDVDLFLKGMLMVVVFSKRMEGKRQVLPDNVSSVPGEPLGTTDLIYLTTLILQRTVSISGYASVRHKH